MSRLLREALIAIKFGGIAILMTATPALGSLLNATDPSADDNGPGNYAYPTDPVFTPGAFDIRRFQVFDDGTPIYFLLTVSNLTPTFGLEWSF